FYLASPVVPSNGVAQIDLKGIRLTEENREAAIIKYQSGQFVVVHYYRQRSNPPEWVAVLGPDGTETFRCVPAPSLPDDSNIQIEDAAVNSRGRLAVSVYATGAGGQRSSVVLVYDISAKSGTALRVIRAFPISVQYLVVDERNN